MKQVAKEALPLGKKTMPLNIFKSFSPRPNMHESFADALAKADAAVLCGDAMLELTGEIVPGPTLNDKEDILLSTTVLNLMTTHLMRTLQSPSLFRSLRPATKERNLGLLSGLSATYEELLCFVNVALEALCRQVPQETAVPSL